MQPRDSAWELRHTRRVRTPRRQTSACLTSLLVQKYQYCWVVDPLDGTKEFIKRVPHFTVNIALVKGSEPIMGVVCTPAAETMHFAVKGQGAFVRCETMACLKSNPLGACECTVVCLPRA